MNQRRLFSALIVSNWVLQLLLYVFPFLSLYADPLIEKLMALDGYGAMIHSENPIIYQLPLGVFLVASVGMLFFKNWARYLYLVSNCKNYVYHY
jgi:hypothetical protein